MLSLNACSIFKSDKESVEGLSLIDDQHYYANRIFLQREHELSDLELTHNYSWIEEYSNSRVDSENKEALRSAYELLVRDQVEQAKTLLLRVLANNDSQSEAKIMLRSIADHDEDVESSQIDMIRIGLGENWQSLAQKYYGSPLQFYSLVRLNKRKAADDLQPGQILKVPNQNSLSRIGSLSNKTPESISRSPHENSQVLPLNKLDKLPDSLNVRANPLSSSLFK